MTAPVTPHLRYLLTSTVLTVHTVVRLAVVPDDEGGHLEPQVAVTLSTPARPVPVTSAMRVPIAPGIAPAWAAPGSMRHTFDHAHPRTAALAADLSSRAEQFLAGLRMGEDPSEVVAFGNALTVVHRELAAADRMRREWIAGQSRDVRSATWDLTRDDLLALPTAPRTLAADVELPGGGQAAGLAAEYGVLVAVVDGTDEHGMPTGPATVVVYRRPPLELPDVPTPDAAQPWRRDGALAHLHLVDELDRPVAGAGVPSPRTPWEDGTDGRGSGEVEQSEAAFVAAETARCQLELLQGSDEYARLAATHARAEELQALEQEARLARGLTRRA
jgi:hypothetical protein